jgi:hypothetical protein
MLLFVSRSSLKLSSNAHGLERILCQVALAPEALADGHIGAFHAAFLEDLKKATPSCQTYDHKSIIYGSLNQPSKSSRDTGHFQDQSYTFMTQTPQKRHTIATQMPHSRASMPRNFRPRIW